MSGHANPDGEFAKAARERKWALREHIAKAILKSDDQGGNAWEMADEVFYGLDLQECCVLCGCDEGNELHPDNYNVAESHDYAPVWFVRADVPARNGGNHS